MDLFTSLFNQFRARFLLSLTPPYMLHSHGAA